jgi:hypothetical protein
MHFERRMRGKPGAGTDTGNIRSDVYDWRTIEYQAVHILQGLSHIDALASAGHLFAALYLLSAESKHLDPHPV